MSALDNYKARVTGTIGYGGSRFSDLYSKMYPNMEWMLRLMESNSELV